MMKTNIYNKIKFISLAVVSLVLATGMNSCVPLDEKPTEVQIAPGAYSDISELRLGVIGIYAKLRQASMWSTFYVNGWSGDDMTTHKVSNKADFREYDQRVITSENSRTVSNWENIYSMIFNANTVLKNIGDTKFVGQEAEQNRLLGEIYFLRGAMFFHLARVHGRIPIPTTPEINYDIQLASTLEVFQQIESDLTQAANLLPDLYPGVEKGAPRPNNGSAKAMLSRLYLDWAGFPIKDNSKYALAASTAKQVIDKAGSHNFTLENNLENLWKMSNRFNNESLWTIAYCQPCGTQNGKFAILGWPGDRKGWGETFAEIRYFEDFPEGARKEATYRTDVDWTRFNDQVTPVFKKITGPIEDDAALSGVFFSSRNDFYMRYAELLLVHAEASARAGNNSAEAWESLNKVRRRAAGLPWNTPVPTEVFQKNADGTPNSLKYKDVTSGDLAELTFTERKWELAGEWIRWNDLVRMERVAQALGNRDPRVTPDHKNGGIIKVQNAILGSLGTENYFAPIPSREQKLLPGLNN